MARRSQRTTQRRLNKIAPRQPPSLLHQTTRARAHCFQDNRHGDATATATATATAIEPLALSKWHKLAASNWLLVPHSSHVPPASSRATRTRASKTSSTFRGACSCRGLKHPGFRSQGFSWEAVPFKSDLIPVYSSYSVAIRARKPDRTPPWAESRAIELRDAFYCRV